MPDHKLFAHLLGIEQPWQIRRVDMDERALRIDVHVGLGKPRLWRAAEADCGRCGQTKRIAPNRLVHVWRHVNLDRTHTYVHVELPNDQVCGQADCPLFAVWGRSDSWLTPAMRQRFESTVRHCKDAAAASRLLGLGSDGAKKEPSSPGPAPAPGHSSAASDAPAPKPARVPPTAPPRAETSTPATAAPAEVAACEDTENVAADHAPGAPASDSKVPKPSDPRWTKLVDGDLNIEIKALGLQMLLARIRTLRRHEPAGDKGQAQVQEIHDYCVKYRRFVQNELDQLAHAQG